MVFSLLMISDFLLLFFFEALYFYFNGCITFQAVNAVKEIIVAWCVPRICQSNSLVGFCLRRPGEDSCLFISYDSIREALTPFYAATK